MNLRISTSRERIAEFCERWKIVEFSFFGSVLRQDFKPSSDVDVLVRFASDAEWSLFDLVSMQEELNVILNRPADLVSRAGLEQSRNFIRKQAILGEAELYYAA